MRHRVIFGMVWPLLICFTSTVIAQLSGSYDVGGGNNDFPSPAAAADSLSQVGVSGPVTFNIYTGTYDGQVNLPAITGSSSANTITFQNAPGQFPVVTSTGQGFYFTGADYVTISGLEITNVGYNGIFCYYSPDSSNHNRFINNYIHDVGTVGNYSGIRCDHNQDCVVAYNEIEADYYGINMYYNDRALVFNNMVYSLETTTGNYYGISAHQGYDNKYYYNSVYTGGNRTMYHYRGYNSIVKNNIFYNFGTSGSRRAYHLSGAPTTYGTISDYNDIYAPNGAAVGYYLAYHYTLAAFQAASGTNANSISADPIFMSYTDTPDLHITTFLPSPVDGEGIPIATVTDDFDFEPRDVSTPDIGADEFTYIPFDYCVILEPEKLSDSTAEEDTLDYMLTIENCGTLNDTFDVTVTVTGETWDHQILDNAGTTVITEIAVNASVIDSFICRVVTPVGINIGDLSYGEVVVWSQGGTDNVLTDTSWITTTGFFPITLPYSEDFDIYDGGYTSTSCGGGGGCWEWGNPTYGPATACSEPYCWGTEIDAAYPNSTCSHLETPPIELQPLATLTFCHWYSIEYGWDGGNVKISTDGGSNWDLLTPVGGYIDTCYINDCVWGEPIYTGHSTTWTTAEFDLSAYGGTTAIIQWNFGSDGSVTYPGWYIDNVEITSTLLESVDDLVISLSTGTDVDHVVLSWTPAAGAQQYHIYKSTTSPDSGFVQIGSTVDTSYTDTYAVAVNNTSFYYVTADNELLDFYDPNITFPDRARHPVAIPIWIQEKHPEKDILRRK